MAREEAIKSPAIYKHGCIAVVSGKIIARGYNNYRTYSNIYTNEHLKWYARVRIISNCQWYLSVAKLKWDILILQRFKTLYEHYYYQEYW